MSADVCPSCASDLTGEPIPQEYLDAGHYAPGSTHYSRLIGVEVRGIYDGTLYWLCPDCSHAWPRFTDERQGLRLVAASAEHAAAHNAAVPS